MNEACLHDERSQKQPLKTLFLNPPSFERFDGVQVRAAQRGC
jgi:hypothetical protein